MRRFVLFVALLLSIPSIAGATNFSPLGNLSQGDCSVVAAAQLVQNHYPGVKVTTSEVLTIWRDNPVMDPLTYLETNGISGKTIAFHYPLESSYNYSASRGDIIQAADSGGIYAVLHLSARTVAGLQLPNGYHAVAVISANSRGLTAVMWGTPRFFNWSEWSQLNPMSMEAVMWP